ncbi:MAG: response regulator [Desulfobacterales bacterium]|nr:response regulator [Desulfobacterales bacterium]
MATNHSGKVKTVGKRILVVDDSSIMRNRIKKILRDGGCEVVGEAKNGEDAIEMYDSLEPELVTMDITMRGMDGFDATKEILKHDKDARIIILSNLADENYAKKAMLIGAKGYVGKREARDILALIEKL